MPLQWSFGAEKESMVVADGTDGKGGEVDAGVEEGNKEVLSWFDSDWFSLLLAGPDVKKETEEVTRPISVSH